MIVQQLLKGDFVQWREFCEIMLGILNVDTMVMLRDETHLNLDVSVNKQNCRYWATEPTIATPKTSYQDGACLMSTQQ